MNIIKKIIIYASKYGNSKRYAMELSRILEVEAINYKELKSLSDYDEIIYLGSLYAGSVLGLSNFSKLLVKDNNKSLTIVTVGLSDPNNEEIISNIRSSLKKQLPEYLYEKAKIFHLRGGIDYGNLNFIHKAMMKFIYNKMKKMPPEKQNSEIKVLIETYNKTVDFVNFDYLNKLLENIQ